MSITFHCGNCGRSLTTAEDRAGQQAKCPGCGEVVTVPQPAAPEALDEGSFSADETPASPDAAAPASSPSTRACPMCGMENPRGAKTCAACGEEIPFDSEDQPRRRRRGTRENIEVGEVLSDAWATFKANFGIALAANIIGGIVVFLAAIPLAVLVGISLFIYLQSDGHKMPPVGLFLGMIPAYLVTLAATCWIMPGVLRFYIRLARQETDIDVLTVFQGGRYFLPFLGVNLALTFGMILATALCGIPGLVLWTFFWPITYIVCDDDSSQGRYWQRTLALTKPLWLVSLMVTFAWLGMNLGIVIVSVIPCVGAIVSMLSILIQPYFQLLWATAYVKMSGRD